MKGPWELLHLCTGGEIFIQVARLRDVSRPRHSGNLEYYPAAFESDADAQKVVDQLNALKKED